MKAKRTRNIFDPNSSKPFKLSRSRIDLFVQCPRCFYIDRRLGVDRVKGFPFNLNSCVDTLLKKEFDVYRAKGEPHPLMLEHGVDAVPFQHPNLDTWRQNFVGVQVLHEPTNLHIFGAVDDVWEHRDGTLAVVDYKSTSINGEITLDASWKGCYKRQMEIYIWLLRGNGFRVSDTGFFVYVNGRKDLEGFHGKLEFETYLLPYTGNSDWVEGTILRAHQCLMGELPEASKYCQWCAYRGAVGKVC